MKVLHIVTWENTGAGRAALRLHQGLIERQVDSLILVNRKTSELPTVITPQLRVTFLKEMELMGVMKFFSKITGQKDVNMFSINFTPSLILNQIKRLKPDIVNIHWMGLEFFKLEDLAKIGVPIVWTVHDMWIFTGGCHYSGGCNRYIDSCGACPQIFSNKETDLSRWVWERKTKAWKDVNLTMVTLSSWLDQCTKSSSLLKGRRIELIPNGIDTKVYKPMLRNIAKDRLGLPNDKQLILFGAVSSTSDQRKGFHLLQPALKYLSQLGWQDRVEIVIFGAYKSDNSVDFGFKSHYLGRLNDDLALALIYAAADVFVAPSLEDNLPNTVMESLACGTPCVAFNIGGMPDLIEHERSGYLAKAYEIEDFARGIVWVLEDPIRYQKLSERARQKVEEEFTLNIQSSRYESLYKSLLK